MPQVGALSLEDGLREERAPDATGLDRAAGRLEAGAEERVGCGADADSGGFGLAQEFGGGVAVEPEGLLGPHVLARGHGGA